MGIELASSFDRKAGVPLDSLTRVANIAARDAIPALVRYVGMEVTVLDDGTGLQRKYWLKYGIDNADWSDDVGGGSGSGVIQAVDIAARDAIATDQRQEGLLVYVFSAGTEPKTFQLVGGISNAHWKEVVTQDSSTAIKNKDIDGGTASNTSRITVPKAPVSTLQGQTPKQASVKYATDTKELLVDDGTILKRLSEVENYKILAQYDCDYYYGVNHFSKVSGDPLNDFEIYRTDFGSSLRGTFSYRLVSTFGSANRIVFNEIDVPRKSRNSMHQISLYYKTSDNRSGVSIYDVTNSSYLLDCETDSTARFPATGVTDKRIFMFRIPANCEKIQFEIGGWGSGSVPADLFFDEVEISEYQMVVSSIRPAIGTIQEFAGPVANIPYGFLHCNGAAISRSTYAKLFAVIGTTYGTGDGSTTFNLPNSQGIGLRGVGTQTFGSKTYTATLGQKRNDNFASHNHTIPSGLGSTVGPAYIQDLDQPERAQNSYIAPHVVNSTITSSNTGSGTETNGADLAVTHMICFDDGPARYADYTLNQDESCSYFTTSTAAIPDSPTVFNFASKIFDKANNVTTGAGWRFEPKSSGIFDVLVEIDINSATTASRFDISLRKNGVIYRETFNTNTAQMVQTARLSTPIELVLGDYIDVQVKESGGLNGVFVGKQVISINKRATSQQLFAPIGPVVVNAENLSGQSIPSGTLTTITGWNKVIDTHGAFNAAAGIFTAQEDGYYGISASCAFVHATWPSCEQAIMYNSTTAFSRGAANINGASLSFTPTLDGKLVIFKLSKGQIIWASAYQTSGVSRNLLADASFNTITIFKVN